MAEAHLKIIPYKMEKIDKRNIEDILALTPMQEGMLFHYLKDPDRDYYFEQLCLDISGKIDFPLFERAWNMVIETNEMLRTVFRWEQVEHPVQIILKQHHLYPGYDDFSDRDARERKKLLEEVKTKDRKKNSNLMGVPFSIHLCKTGKERYEMIISHHHILYDGWSNGILLKEFFEAYETLCDGEKVNLLQKNPKSRFKTFINWLQNSDTDKEEKFWRNYLSGFDTPTGFSIKKTRQQKKIATGNVHRSLATNVKVRIEDFVQKHKITLASLLYCCWGLLLQKYNNCEDVVFGTTVSGRSARKNVKGIEHMVGMFINTIPLRVQAHPGEKISDLLHRINETLKEREEYEHTSLVKIKEVGTSLDGVPNAAFFDSIVVIENYPIDNQWERRNNQLSIHSYSMVESTNFDLTVGIMLFDEIEFNFNYKQEAFDKEDIERLSCHFIRILEDISEYPGKAVYEIQMISEEEKNKLFYELNNTDIPYREVRGLHQLFEEQVERTPDQIAVIGPLRIKYKSYGTYRTYISYRELNQNSNQLAHLLVEKGVEPDVIVGIMANPSLEMAVGLLGILKAGAAYLPIDPEYPEDRKQYMLKDSNAKFLVTTPDLTEKFEKLLIVNCQLLMVNEKPPYCRRLNNPPKEANSINNYQLTINNLQLEKANLAYIIFTSGSTGRPKGVMIEHGNIFNTINWRKKEYQFTVNDKILQLFSFAFDGFITSFFTPLVSGSQVMLLSERHTQDVATVKDVIISHRISHFICAPSFYSALLGAMSPGELPGLKMVTLAGEELKSSLVSKSKQINASLEIINEYGPTENSVATTFFRDVKPNEKISIGKPIANTKLYILDKTDGLLPLGVPGELCVSGRGVARGYLNRSELTAERFRSVFNRSYMSHMSYIYKTGDLARWLSDGNIEFLGRIDHQVKIRGFRIELGEIEAQLLNHEKVRDVAVVVKIDSGADHYLCAYIVSEQEIPVPELRKFLSGRVPAYMIPSYFVFLEKIPLTPNGKVDKKALPETRMTTGADYAPPRDEIEEKLVKIWSEVLGKDTLHPLLIGIDDNFFELGGHSLRVTKLSSMMHKHMNVKMSFDFLFEYSTIRKLAEHIKETREDLYIPLVEAEEMEYYPVSSAQKRMFLLNQLKSRDISDNSPGAMILEGRVDKRYIEEVFKELIKRHEILRTSFKLEDVHPVQVVHKDVEFEIEYYDMKEVEVKVKVEEERSSDLEGTRGLAPLPVPAARSPQPETALISSFIRPFDLSKAPLLRVELVKISVGKYLLMYDMHHIITDDTSAAVFLRDFIDLYNGKEVPDPRIQYKDFACWQNKLVQSERVRKQEEYWGSVFSEKIPLLDLPTDFPRPSVQSFEGCFIRYTLPHDLTVQLNRMAKENNATLYMLLLAIYTILLSRYSGQEDIVVGTPIAGRVHPDLQNIMGFFVNTLAMRNFPNGEKFFLEFLEEVKSGALKAFENQDYQFDQLVDRLSIQQDAGRQKMFDTMLVVQNVDIPLEDLLAEIKDVSFKPYEFQKQATQFDILLHVFERDTRIAFRLDYCTKLFKEETMVRFMDHLQNISREVTADPYKKISAIKVFSDDEQAELIVRSSKEKLNQVEMEVDFDF